MRQVYAQRRPGCKTMYTGKEGEGPRSIVDPPTMGIYNKDMVDKLRELGFVVPLDLTLEMTEND